MRKKARPCEQCGCIYHSADAKSKYCTPACRTAAYRERHGNATVTDENATVTIQNVTDTNCDTTPSPSPSPLNKRIPPTRVGLGESEGIWHSRLRESWAKNQPDGKAAPYSPPGATEKLFLKIIRSKVASAEELAWAGHIYCQRMLGSGQYVVALKTFLGPQGFFQAELDEARHMIASQQVGA